MSLEKKIAQDIKAAMRAKDKVALRGIRAVKAALLLAKTDGSSGEMTEEKEIKLLQKLVKSRRDSYDIYTKQNRPDLAVVEKEEIEVIEKYLPQQMGEEELKAALAEIIAKTGATSMRDMGKVMGMASKQFAGRADGRAISTAVKQLLSK